MNISRVISEKRKELEMTQEQIAEHLGVSTPAVNKWEKGNSYPDITILPALARLLKVDLNTLLEFKAELSDIEVEQFLEELDNLVQKGNYEIAFKRGMEKIREYPNCDKLTYWVNIYLDGARELYAIPVDKEGYEKTFKKFYEQLADSQIEKIKYGAINMLIAYARNCGDFSKAEELINKLTTPTIDKEEQLAILYQQQNYNKKAQRIWEHRIIKGVAQIQTSLINLIEIVLLKNNNYNLAECYADLYKWISKQFCLPEWMEYNAHLAIAIETKDKEKTVKILSQMLPAMKKEWNVNEQSIYPDLTDEENVTLLSSKVADMLCHELATEEKYRFIQDDEEFKKLIFKNTDV